MINETSVYDIVVSLIESNEEGEYWDFKEKWHSNPAELVKDIICFANTVHNMDCYLIIDVSDNYEVTGVSDDRCKQSDIIDTLSNLSFAGDNIPKISVETIMVKEKTVDVLIIHNTYKTPIYLKNSMGLCFKDASILETVIKTHKIRAMQKLMKLKIFGESVLV